ncbi:hypothetical protein TrRE_jg6361 [Triparma retinervis]|uniref:Protein RER1 n=1 Tax=Triparma retinervis TaxID=2557542 RepID=A0A9W6ZP82_9STRA|nr:hypothetical protein TrRE_jg6361 [Triparma retinervis]
MDQQSTDTAVDQYVAKVKRVTQNILDRSTIHLVPRWGAFVGAVMLFSLRIFFVQGYFIIAYGLGIYLLNNFIAFLTPLDLPGDEDDDGLGLPTSEKEGREYRPFARRLPEFKFWLSCMKGSCVAFVMTFIPIFDVPVFWPILLMYFILLFFFTMKRQIMHMYKHKYVPISWGKAKVKGAGQERFGGGMKGARRAD